MSTSPPIDRVLRVTVTDDEWKALRTLAIERDQELRQLATAALHTSPLTKGVFKK